MNGSKEFVEEFFKKLSLELKSKDKQTCEEEVFVAVPHILIPLCIETVKKLRCAVAIAAQNVHYEQSGAYTGETR